MDKDLTDWDAYFMQFAELASTKSKDPHTHYGVAIVDSDNVLRSTGFNGMPRGVNEHLDYRQRAPYRYRFYEHAERNAIYNAARTGVKTEGCTMYVLELPCASCARAIIQAGIREIVSASLMTPSASDPSDWRATVADGIDMMKEAGVMVRMVGSGREAL